MSENGRQPADTDDRAAKIERLEQSLAEEREHSAGLRRNIEELRFRMEILEKSYSRQLEDTRLQLKAAETRVAEQGARNVELDQARQDAIELLTETKAEIDRLTAERDQLRRQLASRDGWHGEGADDDFEEGTINTLMNDAKWISRKRPADEKPDATAEKSEAEAEAEAAEELISPDVVFAARNARDA